MPACVCKNEGAYTWFRDHFHECLYSEIEVAAFFIGYSSLAFWISCQAPQFYKNFKNKSAEALSIIFLLEWFTGDGCGILAAFLTNQDAQQCAVACLFIFMDVCVLSQWVWYTYFHKSSEKEIDTVPSPSSTGNALEIDCDSKTSYEPMNGNSPSSDSARNTSSSKRAFALALPTVMVLAVTTYSSSSGRNNFSGFQEGNRFRASGRMLLSIPFCDEDVVENEKAILIGKILGWIGSIVYVSSRIPQIVKNFRRGSVEGISFWMFFSAVMGNVTYALGILLKATSWKYVEEKAIFLVGSLGTVIFDFCILGQFYYYTKYGKDKHKNELNEFDDVREDDGEPARMSGRGLHDIVHWKSPRTRKPSSVGIAAAIL